MAIKHLIHLVGGEKGGAGKTLFSRTLVQYCIDRGLYFQPVEADYSNPDLATVYAGLCAKAKFSADEHLTVGVDEIFEWGLEKVVVVNLPAQSHDLVYDWINRNELIDLGESHGVGFVHWFVCSGGYDSVKLFLDSIQQYDSRVLHVLVKNLGLRGDWQDVDKDETFLKVTKKCKPHCIIEFPRLSYFERDVMDKQRLKFDVAERAVDVLGVVSRQRIHNFIRDVYKEIDRTGLFKDAPRIAELVNGTSPTSALKSPVADGASGAAAIAGASGAVTQLTGGNTALKASSPSPPVPPFSSLPSNLLNSKVEKGELTEPSATATSSHSADLDFGDGIEAATPNSASSSELDARRSVLISDPDLVEDAGESDDEDLLY